MATTNEIIVFLHTFCTVVNDSETSDYNDLMMDNHDCIEFNEVQYYVPKNNSLYTEKDYLIRDLLIENYLV